jgi:hypothetical protein
MRALIAVALREIIERRAIYGVAAGLGLLPILASQINGFGGSSGNEIGGITAGIVFAALMGGLALLVGGSVIGRDLAERRLSFYFARPISDFAIWGGKFFGGLFLVYTSSLLSLLPALIFLGETKSILREWEFFPITFGITVLLYSFGLIAGVVSRSKSKWLALDLALLPIMMALAFPAIYRFAYTGMNIWEVEGGLIDKSSSTVLLRLFIYGVVGVAVIVLAASLPSSLISFLAGRADIRRAHRALSLSLWGIVFSGLLLFHGYSYWFVSAKPSDLTKLHNVVAAPGGAWMAVQGAVSGRGFGYSPYFLINSNSKSYYRFDRPFMGLKFSADGKHVAWLELEDLSHDSPVHVVTMKLDDQNLQPTRTGIKFPLQSQPDIFISRDGSRVAVIRDKLISVFDLVSGKELMTVSTPANIQQNIRNSWLNRVLFVTPDLLRIYWTLSTEPFDINSRKPSSLEIIEIDVIAKKLETTGRIEAGRPFYMFPQGDRLILSSMKTTNVYDARTGELRTQLSSSEGPFSTKFLSDGRIAMIEIYNPVANAPDTKNARLRILSAEGVEQKLIELGSAKGAGLGGEVSPGRLMVTLNSQTDYLTYNNSLLYLVDINTGAVAEKAERLMPAEGHYWMLSSEPSIQATRFYFNGQSLVSLDLESGQQQTILNLRDN